MITRHEILESIFNDIVKDWKKVKFMQDKYNHLLTCSVEDFIKETGLPLKVIRFNLFYL